MIHFRLTLITLGLCVFFGSGCDLSATGSSATDSSAAGNSVKGSSVSSASGPAKELVSPSTNPAGKKGDSALPPSNANTSTISNSSIIDMTFDDIKFEMEKSGPFDRTMLTPQIEELFGRKIRIRGYIFPTLRKRGLKQFVLVRDNLECCFGPGAALFDCILIDMQAGKTAEYTIRPVAVEGTFQFNEVLGPDGKHLAIFRLEGEKVE